MAIKKIGNEQPGQAVNDMNAANAPAAAANEIEVGAATAGENSNKATNDSATETSTIGDCSNGVHSNSEKTGSIKQVDKSEKREPDKQEYLNARKRVKGGVKIGIIIAIVIVVLGIGGCVFAAVNPTSAGQVKVSKSSSSLVGEYYADVQTLLTKDGFTNIELRPEGDLIAGILHDEGDVDTVSIDGQTTFSSGTKFDKDAKVVISYHSYPNKSSSNTSNANSANTNTSNTTSNSSNTSNATNSSTGSASANTTSASSSATTDSATFRKSVDDYETFIDQYVAFMQKYNSDSANAASMLAEYTKMLAQYEKLSKEMDAVDESKLTADDYAYYLAAMTRCSEKLAAVAQ